MKGCQLQLILTLALNHGAIAGMPPPSPEQLDASDPAKDHSAESGGRYILGVIPFWVAAVVVSCLSSFLTVGGFVLQKKAIQERHNTCPWPKLGDIVLSPKWMLGFTLAIILPLPGDLLAYALAPMSLLAPLSGFTILVNFVMAPWLLGERLQFLPDTAASALILSGTVLTTMTGDHGEESVEMDLERMRDLFVHQAFLGAFSFLIVIIIVALACMYRWRRVIEEAAAARPANPPVHELLLPALVYAAFGCLTNIGLKAMAELMTAGVSPILIGFYALGAVAPFACLQLNFLNRGLRMYLQVIFFPVSSALLVATNTFYGAIFYQEYKAFSGSPGRFVLFASGVVLIMIGINVFQFRKFSECAAGPASDAEESLEAPCGDCAAVHPAPEEGSVAGDDIQPADDDEETTL